MLHGQRSDGVASPDLDVPRRVLAVLRRRMEVELRGPDVGVAGKLLHLLNWRAVLKRIRDRGLPKRMHADAAATNAVRIEAGFACVALMGCSMSQEQHELLGRHFGRVVLMLDGDEAGRAATVEISGRLLYSHWIRTVSLVQGIQPDQLSIEELRLAIGSM